MIWDKVILVLTLASTIYLPLQARRALLMYRKADKSTQEYPGAQWSPSCSALKNGHTELLLRAPKYLRATHCA